MNNGIFREKLLNKSFTKEEVEEILERYGIIKKGKLVTK